LIILVEAFFFIIILSLLILLFICLFMIKYVLICNGNTQA